MTLDEIMSTRERKAEAERKARRPVKEVPIYMAGSDPFQDWGSAGSSTASRLESKSAPAAIREKEEK
jgi:hypothetical protein